MKMYNYEIEGFINFLMDEEVTGKQTRMRSRFAKIVKEHLLQIEEERMALIKQFSYLDENGEPQVIEQEGGSTVFNLKDKDAFNQEFTILMFEEFIIEETEDKKNMLESIAQIVLNTEKKFKGADSAQYERYCNIVLNETETD